MRQFALALAVAPALALAPEAAAQAPGRPAAEHAMHTHLSLTAEHTVRVAPDRATITLGVQSEGRTAAAATAANATAMTGVMAALRRARIAERDVQTTQLSLNPQYAYEEGKSPRITGYQATNTVLVTVRALERLGAVMDAVVAAGGNTVQGVSFELENPDRALDAARREAVAKARARAQLYAEAAGLKVGRILSISEGAEMAPPPPYPMAQARMAMAEAAPTPVAPGELSLTARVSVAFALE